MIRMGVIGYGYWGPQIVRNFHAAEDCEVAVVCDKSPKALRRVKQTYPGIAVTSGGLVHSVHRPTTRDSHRLFTGAGER